jgi:hypothetical protein
MLLYYNLLVIQIYELVYFTGRETERLAQVVSVRAFYSGGTGIESLSGRGPVILTEAFHSVLPRNLRDSTPN